MLGLEIFPGPLVDVLFAVHVNSIFVIVSVDDIVSVWGLFAYHLYATPSSNFPSPNFKVTPSLVKVVEVLVPLSLVASNVTVVCANPTLHHIISSSSVHNERKNCFIMFMSLKVK